MMATTCSDCNSTLLQHALFNAADPRHYENLNLGSNAKEAIFNFSRSTSFLKDRYTNHACSLCSQVWGTYGYDLKDVDDRYQVPFEATFTSDSQHGAQLEVTINKAFVKTLSTLPATLHFALYAPRCLRTSNEANPAAEIVPFRPVNLEVSSSDAFNWAKSCIDTCDASHTQCSAGASQALPLRLIDVSEAQSRAVVRLKPTMRSDLVESDNFNDYRFVALSYCWGKVKFLTTNKSNIAQHLQSIALSDLPQSVQDAIFCTSQLGVRYLWVDALCIVQDDEIEKHTEMDQMKAFYSAAYLTISAANTDRSDQGFLQKRKEISASFGMNLRCPDGRVGEIQLAVHNHYFARPMDPRLAEFEPISRRAWTMQESILSRRILIYSRFQLFWLCRCSFKRDGGNLSWRDFSSWSSWIEPFGSITTSDQTPERETLEQRQKYYHDLWITMIVQYSERQLSYAADKLPALSGLAHEFQTRLRDTYLAGLWRNSLHSDLMWQAVDSHYGYDSRPEINPDSYFGPSWSWASYNGKISQYDRSQEEKVLLASVIDVSVTPMYDFAPLGRAVAASLKIENMVYKVRLQQDLARGLGSSQVGVLGTTPTFCPLLAKGYLDYPSFIASEISQDPARQFAFALVVQVSKYADGYRPEGLLLQPTVNNHFRRIGTFRVDAHLVLSCQYDWALGCTCIREEWHRALDFEAARPFLEAEKELVVIV